MRKQHGNRVRIIGGEWRGRLIEFVDAEGLRPTKDLIRETLFNWLQFHLPGSRCLDAFAGSGALGFEAASRGAAEVVMVEASGEVTAQLRRQASVLQATQVEIVYSDLQQYLQRSNKPLPFDIVFLDPPFNTDLLMHSCEWLHNLRLLQAGAHIYLEAAKAAGLPSLPAGWNWLKQKQSGDVAYGLAKAG
jgi:16S rRNA (guanine966-N2)-methyltransferase